MKYKKNNLITILCCVVLMQCMAPQSIAQFVHPGMLHSKDELNQVKENIQNENSIHAKEWNILQKSKCAQLSWTSKACEVVERGAYNNPNIGAGDFMKDGRAAYTMSLRWYMTKDKRYALKAIEIINDWSYTLKQIKGHDAKLLVGMTGIKFLNAAEIIKHTSNHWKKKDQKAFEKMVLEVWYPVIQDFFPKANGNWDASMIQTMLCMGIFVEDQQIFDRAKNYYLSGVGNGAIGNYFNDFGECQESGRDQAHTQMGLGYLANACEIAWQQGIDLYGALSNRLYKGYEYTAKFNLGEEVKYVPYISYEGKYRNMKISEKGRGRFSPIYEQLYNHYHGRKKIEMPYVKRVIIQDWNERVNNNAHVSWGTLMNR
ncbi:hypothetical protein EYV94_05015 [Puteibacter caeruleilacunae]|nr:hypothetical protein EYV94_05015 [Puteibacter caeruleilacunae]